jgi:hypothetical protein
MIVKVGDGQLQKVYGLLISCAVTRAVSIELSMGLSQEAFLMAFRRHIARRGKPATAYSDNYSTFKKTEADIRVLNKIVRSMEIKKTLRPTMRLSGNLVHRKLVGFLGFLNV